jgi:hypothetical protein
MSQSYFPSAACGVTETAKALPSVLVYLTTGGRLKKLSALHFSIVALSIALRPLRVLLCGFCVFSFAAFA